MHIPLAPFLNTMDEDDLPEHRSIKETSPVPAWIILRTKRSVRTNPKRRAWRSTDVEVG